MYGWCKTDKMFAKWLQGTIRKTFSKHPARLALIERKRYQAFNKNTGRKCYHIDCEKCNTSIPMGKGGGTIEVNHKNTVGGFKDLDVEKFKIFVVNLLLVREDELELLCRRCHGIVTYSERSGMTIEESAIEKRVIKFCSRPAVEQKRRLIIAGMEPEATVAKRRIQLRNYLRNK